jgi:hypothetical protein
MKLSPESPNIKTDVDMVPHCTIDLSLSYTPYPTSRGQAIVQEYGISTGNTPWPHIRLMSVLWATSETAFFRDIEL